MFSPGAVDIGTKLLLREVPIPEAEVSTIADIGCGYGPIAVAMGIRAPHAQIYAVEVNDRARDLCRSNANQAGLTNVVVAPPEEIPAGLTFDRIYSNPPIRVGKAALHELLDTWLARLTPDGVAYLVVQKHLGADSLAKHLTTRGFVVNRLVSRRAYRVLEVRPGNRVEVKP